MTRFRRLPEQVPSTKAEPTETAQSGAGRRPMTPQERARHAALVRWGKQNPLAARIAALREKRAADAAAATAPKPKVGAKPKAKPKPKPDAKPKPAPKPASLAEQVAAGLKPQRRNEKPLAEQAGAGLKPQKEQEPKKKGGGGGGGGGKEQKPTADEKAQAKEQERQQRATDTAREVGLRDLDGLRQAADKGGADSDELRKLGLVDDTGNATDQGRRALSALERGDVRGYRAALQDAEGRMGRERIAGERRAKAESERAERDAERQQRDADRQAKEREREQRQADRERQASEREQQELDDLADDFRRGRRGLSFEQQRRLIRAGRATMNGEKFELKGDDAVGLTEDEMKPRRRTSRLALARERARLKKCFTPDEMAMVTAMGLAPRGPDVKRLNLELALLEVSDV